MAGVVFEDVTKEYPNGFKAVKNLDLDIRDGEFLVMVGPSGCGKSTTLRMIAGLEEVSAGKIKIGDRVVNDVHPKDRDIAMVFQNYALYPHMTVADNIGFALKLAKRPKTEIRDRVLDAAKLLDLTEQLDKKPAQLSGGQRQRVAMGRAIVRTPQVFLLDEPLSNLDAKLRVQMRAEITHLQRKVGVTTFYVTHDQIEAMTMADRVAVINFGVLQQVAPPQELFDRPDNIFVAAFIGSPSMNLLEGTLIDEDGSISVRLSPSASIGASEKMFAGRDVLKSYVGKQVVVGLRPKDLKDAALSTQFPQSQRFRGEIFNVEALGYERMVYVALDATRVVPDEVLVADGDVLTSDEGTIVTARFDSKSSVKIGQTAEVAVDMDNAHFFDPSTGLAIRD
ncbi:MAG: ABC transporter ATP-binding protein [Actinobacteria bacterium RBG_16_68_21]|nr:MAG: ABC transporter ATP-binding protein [Actinobacteria bacterium RBG_16_68_21]